MSTFSAAQMVGIRSRLTNLYNNSFRFYPNQTRIFHIPLRLDTISTLNQNSVRSVCSTVPCMYKYYKESENELAHESMVNNRAYSESVVQHPLTHRQPQENPAVKLGGVFKVFHDLTLKNTTNQLDLGHKNFVDVSHDLAKSFQNASYDELIHTLYCMCFWPFTPKSYELNFKRIWNTLDYECVKRVRSWSVHQKLLVCDYWFHLRLNRITLYNLAMIKELIHQKDDLTVSHIVQLMFFINLQRTVPQSLLSMLESKIEAAVKTVDMEELNIICLGYFKTESVILNQNIIKNIINKVSKNLGETESHYLNGIIKCLRKSFQPHLIGYYGVFIKKCGEHAHKWNIQASIHAALMCSTSNIFEPNLLDNAIIKLKKQVHLSRLKDITKLIQCVSIFNYLPSQKFNDFLLDELLKAERREEILGYAHDAVQLVLFFAYMGYYRYDILKLIMSTDIIDRVQKIDKSPFVILDYCIEIECKDYDGPRLTQGLRNHLVESNRTKKTHYAHGIIKKATESVLRTLQKIYGENNVCMKHVLPHLFNADLILRIDNKTKTPLCDIVKNCPDYEVLVPPTDETWICFVICGPFSFAYSTDRLTGITILRQRHLKALGYNVALINYKHVHFDDSIRETYIKNIVNSVINNNLPQLKNLAVK